MNSKVKHSIIAGIIATAFMSILAAGIADMLASFMHIPLAMGWVLHFMVGIILSFIFFFFFLGKLPGNLIIQGVLYSLIPFIVAQMIMMPMMDMGIFSSKTEAPLMNVMGSLGAHIIYGLVLGLYAKYIANRFFS